MLDQRLRGGVEQWLRPMGVRLRRSGFTADQITLLGLAASAFTGAAIASGHFLLAAAGLAASGATDVLDGAVAKAGGTSGPRGSFFDSVADRVSDAMVLGGAAWWLADRQPHLTLLPFAVAVCALLVSYERAKAEALGLDGKGGLMERAERMVVLGCGLLFSALVPALWLLLATTGLTAVQRFFKVWRQTTPRSEESPGSGVSPRASGSGVSPRASGSGVSPRASGSGVSPRASGSGVSPRAWWIRGGPALGSESRSARWRAAARPPGERSRPVRWRVSSRPPRSEGGASRLARWWDSRRAPVGERSPLRRLRGRTRP